MQEQTAIGDWTLDPGPWFTTSADRRQHARANYIQFHRRAEPCRFEPPPSPHPLFLPDVAVVSFKIETEVFNKPTRHRVPLGNVSCSSIHTNKISEMIVRDRN